MDQINILQTILFVLTKTRLSSVCCIEEARMEKNKLLNYLILIDNNVLFNFSISIKPHNTANLNIIFSVLSI